MTREEAIQVLNTYDVNFDEYRAEEIADAIDMAIEALMTDIVRCGECKLFNPDIDGFMWCNGWDESVYNDGFCHLGVRKEK